MTPVVQNTSHGWKRVEGYDNNQRQLSVGILRLWDEARHERKKKSLVFVWTEAVVIQPLGF
jgi:hypothetical protein